MQSYETPAMPNLRFETFTSTALRNSLGPPVPPSCPHLNPGPHIVCRIAPRRVAFFRLFASVAGGRQGALSRVRPVPQHVPLPRLKDDPDRGEHAMTLSAQSVSQSPSPMQYFP